MTRDISFSRHRFQLSMHATTSPFIAMNYKFIHGNSLLSFISDFVGYLSTSVPPLSVGCPFSLFEIPTLLFLYCLWVVDWAPYSVVPLLSVGCCLSYLFCYSFTFCLVLFEFPTLLFLYYLWVDVWAPYSVVPSLSVGCCLMSLLCCCGLLFDVPTLLFLHEL